MRVREEPSYVIAIELENEFVVGESSCPSPWGARPVVVEGVFH